MSRMTDERLAELTLWVDDPHIKVLTKELVAALKAERERVRELEGHVVEVSINADDRDAWKAKAEAAEARIKELEVYDNSDRLRT